MATSAAPAPGAYSFGLGRLWPIATGVALLSVPTFIELAQTSWSTEAGIHGPIVLATGGWLIARAWPAVRVAARPGSLAVGVPLLVATLTLYAFGRAFDFLSLESAGLLGALVSIAYLMVGGAVLRRLWFPIVYLGFLIPLPGALVDEATAPLKTFVSWSVTEALQAVGYPIVRGGVALYIDQYQLLVEDACSGLNSLISLTAISLFYIYLLHNASWRYSVFLLFWILPVAIFANLVRVTCLVLITYYFGNAAAQGFLHSAAGLVMFATALIGIFAVDGLMTPVRNALAKAGR
jgi:exosortase B